MGTQGHPPDSRRHVIGSECDNHQKQNYMSAHSYARLDVAYLSHVKVAHLLRVRNVHQRGTPYDNFQFFEMHF